MENFNYNNLNNGLKSLQDLRYHLKSLFNSCGNDKDKELGRNGSESIDRDIQHELKAILLSYCNFEKNVNTLSPINLNLGNIGYLSQDPLIDRNELFIDSLQAYNWSDMLLDNSSAAASLLTQNSLKRATKPKKSISTSNNLMPSHLLDAIINGLDRLFLDMTVSTENRKPYGSTILLNITLGTVLRATMSLRNLIIEGITIRGYNEKELTMDDNGNYFWSELVTSKGHTNKEMPNESYPEIWVESKYEVFQKITNHAQAAMLHFYSPLIPELAIKSFMTWLHSYSSLFNSSCHRCQKHLLEFFPPTWRDFRTLESFHESCRH